MAGRGDIQAGRAFVELFLKNRMTPALTKALMGAKKQLLSMSGAAKFVGQTFNKLGGAFLAAGATITAPFLAALSRLKEGKAIFEDIGDALAEGLGKPLLPILRQVRVVVHQFAQWAKQNPELIRTIFKIGVGLTIAGVAFKALGFMAMSAASGLAIAAAAMGVIAGIVAFIGTPFGAFIALLAGSAAAWAHFTKAGQMAMEHIRTLFVEIGQIGREIFGGIADAIMAGDLVLAAQVAWAGIMLVWHKGTQDINRLWTDAKFFFLSVWQEATTGAAKFFISLWAGIDRAWTEVVFSMQSVWINGVAAMAKAWTGFQNFVLDGMTILAMGTKNVQMMMALQARVARGEITQEQAHKTYQDFVKLNAQLAIGEIGKRGLDQKDTLAELERQRAADIAAAQKRHDDRINQINADEAGAKGILEGDRQRAQDELAKRRAAAIAEKQKAVDDAQKEFDAARAKAGEAAKARQLAPIPGFDFGGEKPTVTFSGTGLLAAGQGGGPMRELIKVAQEQNRKLGDIAKGIAGLKGKPLVMTA